LRPTKSVARSERGCVMLRIVLIVLLLFSLVQPAICGAGRLAITFLDVGCGDAALITTPKGEHILIDAGPEASADRVVRFLAERKINTIDIAIATHPHPDHIGGFLSVFGRFAVKSLYQTDLRYDDATFKKYSQAVSTFDGTLIVVRGRMVVRLPSGVILEFIMPKGRATRIHTDCIVVRVRFGSVAILLTADMSKQAEQILLSDGVAVRSQILKVSHHGASDSSSSEFLDAVRPRYAVISVGVPNRWGRPHKEVLESLARRDITVLRTDLSGNITFVTDGKVISLPVCERGKAGVVFRRK